MTIRNGDDGVPPKGGNLPVPDVQFANDGVPMKPASKPVLERPAESKKLVDFAIQPSSAVGCSSVKPGNPILIYGLVGLSIISLAAAAFSYSTRHPIPSDAELQSGSGPFVELLRTKLDESKKISDKKMDDQKNAANEKLRAAEADAQLAQKQQLTEVERLSSELTLKEAAIRKAQEDLASKDADHKNEMASTKSKIDELEKQAQAAKDALIANEASIEKELASINKPATKTERPIMNEAVAETKRIVKVRRHLPVPRLMPGKEHMVKSTSPGTVGNLVYGFDQRTERGYWYVVGNDGRATGNFASSELAISAAESGRMNATPANNGRTSSPCGR